MKNITNASLYRTDGYRTIVNLINGTVSITEAIIRQSSMTVDSAMVEGEAFQIGTAMSDEVHITIDNSSGDYGIAIVGQEFELYIAPFPVDGSVSRANASWSLFGTYIVMDAQEQNNDQLTLTLNDRMVLLDRKLPDGFFAVTSTLKAHLQWVCSQIGASLILTTAEDNFLSAISVVSASATHFADMTYRDLVRYCAEIMWENAYMTPDGNLAFRPFASADIVTTPSTRYSSLVKTPIVLGPVSIVDAYGNTYYQSTGEGSQSIVIDESANRVVELIGPTLLAEYYEDLTIPGSSIVGYTYYPMEMTCLPYYEAQPGDRVGYTKDGTTVYGIITSIGAVINGAISITSAAESPQRQLQYIRKNTDSEIGMINSVATEFIQLEASATEFVSYDYNVNEPETATFEPTSITINAQIENCEFGLWQYSYNGELWNDVIEGLDGITATDSSLTVLATSERFSQDGNTYLVFRCVSSDGQYSDTVTISRTVEPTTLFKKAFTDIEEADGKIALIASDEQLSQLGEQLTLFDQVSQLQITAEGISAEVSRKVNDDEIISRINQSAEEITIDATKVNLNGYVTIQNLENAGETVINGSNITTGEISADRISGGVLQLGRELNVAGVMEVYDEDNNLLSREDSAGKTFYKNDGSYVRINGEDGFAGYDADDAKVFWADEDEFHMRKSVVEEEITLGAKARFIPITIMSGSTVVNDGIGLIAVSQT